MLEGSEKMKLIMENWKSFLLENKKQEIRDLRYGEIKSNKYKKRLSQETKIIDVELSDIPITKHPPNDSEAVKTELKKVLSSMSNNRELSKKELEKTDKKPKQMFTKYLKDNDLEFDKEFIDDLVTDVAIISLKLKVRYNRPRPEQLGHLVGYDVRSIKTETDDTPSYPSGHTAQAWTVAYYLADKFPDHKDELYAIAEKIENSRIVRGAHYPSDNKEAKKIAKKYLFPNIKQNKSN
mgnify:CR=1 FL=1|tara:strand:+ start:9218 stop:9928 length:711 start_codon:yes stop_codon:yes gene_type:complete